MKNIKKFIDITFLWFLAGFGLFVFTRTSSYVPIMIFIAPVFILRFLRNNKPVKGIILTIIGFILSLQIALPGFYLDTGNVFSNIIIDIIKDLILAIVFAAPYVADRFISDKTKGFAASFVFPVSAVLFYFLKSKFPPFDGIPIYYAYTQYGNMPLVQFLSIAGTWGMIFLISWFASTLNWIWENKLNRNSTRTGVFIFSTMFILILCYGGFKISPYFFDYKNKSVKTASIVFDEKTYGIDQLFDKRIFTKIDQKLSKIGSLVKLASANNAKIIAFQEFSLIIPQKEEKNMQLQLKKIARENKVYLCINYVPLPPLLNVTHEKIFDYTILKDEEKGKNKVILINDQGEIIMEYLKDHFVTGEDLWVEKGTGGISFVNTPYGRISIVICRDMEFPDYLRTAGKLNADIVIAPSYETAKSLSITYMQMLRAVEYGFSFIRPCANGLSIAIDYNGTILSSMNSYTTTGEIMYADVPVKGIRTFYTLIGDLFAWLCVPVFIVFVVMAVRNKTGKKTV